MVAFYWLMAAAILIVLEILTMGLTTIWFAGGALLAAVAAMLSCPVAVQIIVFAVTSLVLLLITRPLATHFLNNKTVKTNAESLIGQSCLVTKDIDNLRASGEVTVRGQTWSARSESEEILIPAQTVVEIVKISGVKLIVRERSGPEEES